MGGGGEGAVTGCDYLLKIKIDPCRDQIESWQLSWILFNIDYDLEFPTIMNLKLSIT